MVIAEGENVDKLKCLCGATATCVVDVREAGKLTMRMLGCRRCASRAGRDVVVLPEDFEAVVGSGACWCHSSRVAGVNLLFCPEHGANPLNKERN